MSIQLDVAVLQKGLISSLKFTDWRELQNWLEGRSWSFLGRLWVFWTILCHWAEINHVWSFEYTISQRSIKLHLHADASKIESNWGNWKIDPKTFRSRRRYPLSFLFNLNKSFLALYMCTFTYNKRLWKNMVLD